MKQIVTIHGEIGYTNNVQIIERALRERFGINDGSHLALTIAAHVWSQVCQTQLGSDNKKWGTAEIMQAFRTIEWRMNQAKAAVALTETLTASADATAQVREYLTSPQTAA